MPSCWLEGNSGLYSQMAWSINALQLLFPFRWKSRNHGKLRDRENSLVRGLELEVQNLEEVLGEGFRKVLQDFGEVRNLRKLGNNRRGGGLVLTWTGRYCRLGFLAGVGDRQLNINPWVSGSWTPDFSEDRTVCQLFPGAVVPLIVSYVLKILELYIFELYLKLYI